MITLCGDCYQEAEFCSGPFGACGNLSPSPFDDDDEYDDYDCDGDLLGNGVEPESGYNYLNA